LAFPFRPSRPFHSCRSPPWQSSGNATVVRAGSSPPCLPSEKGRPRRIARDRRKARGKTEAQIVPHGPRRWFETRHRRAGRRVTGRGKARPAPQAARRAFDLPWQRQVGSNRGDACPDHKLRRASVAAPDLLHRLGSDIGASTLRTLLYKVLGEPPVLTLCNVTCMRLGKGRAMEHE
jgi:hypothetical protein